MSSNISSTWPMDRLGDGEEENGPLINLFVPLFMFCTGVLGNVIALVLLWRSRHDHRRSVFYRLVAGLTLTDLLGIVATSPVTLLVYSNDRQWVGGSAVCDYFSFMMIFAGLATVLMVGCMAVERFLAIIHPYIYERHIYAERANRVLAGIWVISAFISCLPLMQVGHNVQHWPGTWCFFDFFSQQTGDKIFSFLFVGIGLIVIVSTAVCNVAVMVVLLRMRRVSQNIGQSPEGRTLNMTSEMQMIFFLAGIILVFTACYVPLMVRVIMNVTQMTVKDEKVDLLVIRLASVNQILDPWVYLLFRRRLANLLYSLCKSVSPMHTLSSLKTLRNTGFNQDSLRKDLPSLLPPSPPESPELGENTAVGEKKLSAVAEKGDVYRRCSSGPGEPVDGVNCSQIDVEKSLNCNTASGPINEIAGGDFMSKDSSMAFLNQGLDDKVLSVLALEKTSDKTVFMNGKVLSDDSSFRDKKYHEYERQYCRQCLKTVPCPCLPQRQNDYQKQNCAHKNLQLFGNYGSHSVCKCASDYSKNKTGDHDNNGPNRLTRKQDTGPNGTLTRRFPMNTMKPSSKPGSQDPQLGLPTTKLTASASCPVICRHGNQTVIKTDGEEDSGIEDYISLWTKRHSFLGPQCVLCHHDENTDLRVCV